MVCFRNCLAILSLLAATQAFADSGDPVAVRRWPAGAISVETMWNLNLVIDTTGKADDKLKATADQVVTFQVDGQYVLYRRPNTDQVQWQPAKPHSGKEPNEVFVTSFRANEADTAWAVQVMVDDVSILCIDANRLPQDIAEAAKSMTAQDVIVVTADSLDRLISSTVEEFLQAASPQTVILNPTFESETELADFETAVRKKSTAIISPDNTLAVSSNAKKNDKFKTYTLTEFEQALPEELAELFARMEKSCEHSQQVFSKLSVDQMNWKPSNGTHTPRWNTEHMMGRQLLFFSQIYHAIDPSIPALNLNPKQMPDDYQYAHEDWTGTEEARQMNRVSKFTRRFAYLIRDLNVNRRAPGSRWPSLKALLLQMERHYSEHTANTVKKFDLPDWPKQ